MMENYLDSVVVLNDANEAFEKLARYQKPYFHISMQQKALFRYKQYDRLFLHLSLVYQRRYRLGTGT